MLTIFGALFRYLDRCGRSIVTGWDHFFFAPKDPIMLAVIRIMVGAVLLHIHVSCVGEALHFIGPEAWVDAQSLPEIANVPNNPFFQPPKITPDTPPDKIPPQYELDEAQLQQKFTTNYGWSIWFWIKDPTWVLVTYYVGIACVACFTFGLFTRVTAVLTWAFQLNYIHRSMTIWFGMDAMIAFLTLYLMIGPCGRVLSLDRLIARWRSGKMQPVLATWTATVPLRLIQLHMCLVYLIAGVAKLQGKQWWFGNATWLTMNAPLFNDNFNVDWIANPQLGEWFWHYVCFFSSYATLVFEIGFPFLIWNKKLRPWFLFGAFVLHLGIGLLMGLAEFGLVMLAGCMAFIPPEGFRWFMNSLFGTKVFSSPVVTYSPAFVPAPEKPGPLVVAADQVRAS
jgi:hypothetical protein